MKNLLQTVLAIFGKREKTDLELLILDARQNTARIERAHKNTIGK